MLKINNFHKSEQRRPWRVASLPAAAAAVKFIESWEFSIFVNSVIFSPIWLFHSIFGNFKASPFILETFQTLFQNDKWPKKASEVGGRAICSGAIVELWNHTKFDKVSTDIAL